jgi:hypothetical protein
LTKCSRLIRPIYVPRPQRGPSVKAGLFRKDEFQYDADSDSYVCPAGQHLYPYSSSLLRGLKKINYTNKLTCDDCEIRSQCTNGRFRTVSRLENEAVLDRMQAWLAQHPGILDRRREAVERPFGTIKQWMNQGAFLMLGDGSRRIQPDRARLQSQAGPEYCWVCRVDGRTGGLKGSCLGVSDDLADTIAESHAMERIFPMDSTVTLIIAFPAPTPEADSVGIDETQVFTRSA